MVSSSSFIPATSYYMATGLRIAQRSSAEGLSYIHADHLGSSVRLSGGSGALIRSQGYKPYGSDAYLSQTIPVQARYQFTGQEKDDTGLYYYNARNYDPGLGRFASVDPGVRLKIDLSIGEIANPYAYCANNPIKYTDPTGMKGDPEGGANAYGPTGIIVHFPQYFKQNSFSEAYTPYFGSKACAATSLINEISERYTMITHRVMTFDQALTAMDGTVQAGSIAEANARVNNWE